MATDRRNFIAASAMVSLAGTSIARADASSPWICFLHSTQVKTSWQNNFFQGLLPDYVADPEGASALTLNVLFHHAGGKYKSSGNGNLSQAVQHMISEVNSQPKCFVATGGMVSALAADTKTGNVPLLVIIGRSTTFQGPQSVYGYYLDVIDNTGKNQSLQSRADNLLNKYNIQRNKQYLLFNGNSNMGSNEASEWANIVQNASQSIDGSGGNPNDNLPLRRKIKEAKSDGAQAIVVSGDPQFFTHAAAVVREIYTNGMIGCYPFQDYNDHASNAGLSPADYMIYGPDLNTVYQQLGTIAKNVLKGTAGSPGLTAATSSYTGQ